MNDKIRVYVDVFCYKSSSAGIKTYIDQLYLGFKESNNKKIEYIFSHVLSNQTRNSIYFNSKLRFIRWIYHINYFIWKQLLLPIKVYFNNADYLICPDFILPLYKLKAKKICVIHDTLFWDYPKNYNFLWREYFLKMITLGIDDQTKIVTTSNYSKNKIQKKFSNKVYVNYQFLSISNKTFKEPDFIIDKDKYILHVGSFEKRKNIITLVKAFKIFRSITKINFKLILAGNNNFFGNTSVNKDIISFVNKNNLNKDVIIPGYLTNSEIAYLYSNANCYVFPSLDEGFGIPVLESFYFKCPIICSDIDALKEVGGDSVLYFKKNDYKELCKKLLQINDDETRISLIQRGKDRLLLFSLKKFISNYEKIILEK